MDKSLLPINATEQERALELATSRLADLPVEIGKLWNPDDCPEALLPWLAWGLSLDEWDSNWSEQTKRTQIKNAVFTHHKKGTVGSVKRALASLGVSFEFLEWFDDVDDVVLAPVHNTTPHSFVFVAWANENPYTSQEVFLNQKLYDTISRIVQHHKPVRSHFDFLVGAKLDSQLLLGATSTGWTQLSRTFHRALPVQIPAHNATVSAAMSTSRQNSAVNRHFGTAKPVQVPTKNNISTSFTVSGQRYAVCRFYMHG